MKELEKLINFYMENKEELNKEKDIKVVQYVKDGFKNDIIEEIENARGAKLKEKMRKEVEEERRLERLKELKVIILEAIFFSFAIGMLVNQSTEVVNLLNKEKTINITLFFIIIFLMIIYFFYKYKVYTHLIDYLEKKKERKDGD
ncbi:hypothetical protein [Fusobacterium sp. MFO224]|uniref:hypothetical protein n=1 Tax=Fusobacterium sp. MFO224 TaxID=3378070 RepID=UPI0038519C7D